MKELEFKNWLKQNGYSQKMQSDFTSRIKRLERSLEFFDIDKEYELDKCERLKSFLSHKCKEKIYKGEMSFSGSSKQHSVFKYSVNKYTEFMNSFLEN